MSGQSQYTLRAAIALPIVGYGALAVQRRTQHGMPWRLGRSMAALTVCLQALRIATELLSYVEDTTC